MALSSQGSVKHRQRSRKLLLKSAPFALANVSYVTLQNLVDCSRLAEAAINAPHCGLSRQQIRKG
jgi:hypothetical protein